ncbi:LuxR C-terminal-related transcriptional regulator [Microbispora sp. CA-135349]|uniref:LuxR C-terminal-related transcriptional regulator n=1 Tax=Microbispora sp. CA-135349 TaxID=3239953 RepID=UPI003D8A6C14
MIKILLIGEHASMRSALRLVLDAEPDMEVVGESPIGEAGTRIAVTTRPDVVLLDTDARIEHGIEAVRRLTGDHRLRDAVLVFTSATGDEHLWRALHAGAKGFLHKDRPCRELLEAIRDVAAGGVVLSPGHTRHLVEELTSRSEYLTDALDRKLGIAGLSDREREVLTLVGLGLTNAEIGARLHISELTAKTHVSRIRSKLDARDRVELVIDAFSAGLVTMPATRRHAAGV